MSNPIVEARAHVVRAGKFASVWRYRWPGDELWREHEVPNPIIDGAVESLVAENARLREALEELREMTQPDPYMTNLIAFRIVHDLSDRALKGDD
jgi:hypothetical protein